MDRKFVTATRWTSETDGLISTPGAPPMPVSAPPAFGGHPGWSPELLLVGAAEGCTMLTFLAMARAHRLVVEGYESTAEASLGRDEGGVFRMKEIRIRPRITLAPGQDLETARRIIGELPTRCFIGASLKTEPAIEAELLIGGPSIEAYA